jgi:hypothetical protein
MTTPYAGKAPCYISGLAPEHVYALGEYAGLVRGRLDAMGRVVERIFDLRGLTLTMTQRDRILWCFDLAQLDTWFVRAVTADTADEVFAD